MQLAGSGSARHLGSYVRAFMRAFCCVDYVKANDKRFPLHPFRQICIMLIFYGPGCHFRMLVKRSFLHNAGHSASRHTLNFTRKKMPLAWGEWHRLLP